MVTPPRSHRFPSDPAPHPRRAGRVAMALVAAAIGLTAIVLLKLAVYLATAAFH
jgi:hypothetical protein